MVWLAPNWYSMNAFEICRNDIEDSGVSGLSIYSDFTLGAMNTEITQKMKRKFQSLLFKLPLRHILRVSYLCQYSKNSYIRTKKLRTFEAEIFCYAPSKQEPSWAWNMNKVLNKRALLNNISVSLKNVLPKIPMMECCSS